MTQISVQRLFEDTRQKLFRLVRLRHIIVRLQVKTLHLV